MLYESRCPLALTREGVKTACGCPRCFTRTERFCSPIDGALSDKRNTQIMQQIYQRARMLAQTGQMDASKALCKDSSIHPIKVCR